MSDSPASTLPQATEQKNSSRSIPGSVLVWLALAAYLALVKIVLDTLLPGAFADPAQASLFGWVPLAVFATLGLAGVWLSTKTGFPDAWDKRSSLGRRVLAPLVVGAGFGLALVLLDSVSGFARLVAARHGLTQQYTDFPSMLLIFTAAPIIVEVVYRLFLVPLVLWLTSSLLLKGRGQATIFWALAVLSSALEPFSQTPDLQILPGVLPELLAGFYLAVNLTQAAFWRKHGFLAAILVRVGFYIVWHVLYVH
jgi:hypothetical protein